MGKTFKDSKSEKRKPTKKQRRDMEKLRENLPQTLYRSSEPEFKSSYKSLKIEE